MRMVFDHSKYYHCYVRWRTERNWSKEQNDVWMIRRFMVTKGDAMKCLLALTFSVLGAVCGTSQGLAAQILNQESASFAVLGASTVTNTGATTLVGNLGVSPGSSITGSGTITLSGTVHATDSFASQAQIQLGNAIAALGPLGPGTVQPLAELGGLTLSPGIYTVPAGVNLTGTLTLNGGGLANPFWVFEMGSTLITASNSKVDLVNVSGGGAGAGVFWNVGSSATLGTGTSFEGNILASTSITLNTGATIGCGRALAHTGAVTMQGNTISIGCAAGTGADLSLSNGLSGPLVGDASPLPLPSGPPVVLGVPEPSTLLLLGFGLAGVAGAAWRRPRK